MGTTKKQASIKSYKYRAVKKKPTLALNLFVRSLQEHFPTDPSCPGITISWLPGLKMYYTSVVRFKSMWGKDSYNIFNTKAESAEEALSILQEMWLSHIAPSKDATKLLLAGRN